MKYLESPIPYMGNKYKLLKQLIPLFPAECNIFFDMFGGSGVVSMNYHGETGTIYNEFNYNIYMLAQLFKNTNPDELDVYFDNKISTYGLERCSIKAKDRVNRSGYERRKDSFNKFREDYNKSIVRDYRDLFLLSCYSINHLIRFNTNNDFNASSGADSYNEKNYRKIWNMHEAFANVAISNENVFDLDFEKLIQPGDFVYCDPPYTNTTAVYNEKRAFGGWTEESDKELFAILEKLHNRGIKWGLSNVMTNRGKENTHLIEWCAKNNWYVYHLNRNYNPFSRGNSNNDEVYICNYCKKWEDLD